LQLTDASPPHELFDKIKRNDIMVHHPYQSFKTSTQYFLETAARDPQVIMGLKSRLN
jgi:polyphosphate kinase